MIFISILFEQQERKDESKASNKTTESKSPETNPSDATRDKQPRRVQTKTDSGLGKDSHPPRRVLVTTVSASDATTSQDQHSPKLAPVKIDGAESDTKPRRRVQVTTLAVSSDAEPTEQPRTSQVFNCFSKYFISGHRFNGHNDTLCRIAGSSAIAFLLSPF